MSKDEAGVDIVSTKSNTLVYSVYWKILTDTPTAVRKDGRSFHSYAKHFESLNQARDFQKKIVVDAREIGYDYFDLHIKKTSVFGDN